MRSPSSGGHYQPWCNACAQWLRGGHEGQAHVGKVLRQCGLDSAAPPPAHLMQSGMHLPAGVPKVLNEKIIRRIDEMLLRVRVNRSGRCVEVTNLSEAGMRCLILVGYVRLGALLSDDEVSVSMTALANDDDDELGLGGLRTLWLGRSSLQCAGAEYKGGLPIMPASCLLYTSPSPRDS